MGQGAGLCLRNHSKGSSRVNVGSEEKDNFTGQFFNMSLQQFYYLILLGSTI